MDKKKPYISVVIPIRNEARFIDSTIKTIIAQDYPKNLVEIFVVDGMSDDGTRDIVLRHIERDPRIRLIENPEGFVSSALNRGIEASAGDIIIRIDGHCQIENDFISENVKLMNQHPEAWSTGGPIVHVAKTDRGKAIALAMGHPFGSGNANHRNSEYEGYAEGAPFPAYRSEIFRKTGLFDENFIRNQDDEFNFRIGKSGGKVFISPRVKSKYFVRETFAQLYKQYLQYGFWRCPFLKKHKQFVGIRQVVPVLFFLMCMTLGIIGLLLKSIWIALFLPTLYLVVSLFVSIKLLSGQRIGVVVYVPLALFCMHLGYAVGFFIGVLRMNSWSESGQMMRLSR